MELAYGPLSDLFDQYEDDIELLRESIPRERQQGVDNLYLLRYVLSYGGAGQATVDALLKGLEWRSSHKSLVEGARSCVDELDSSPLAEYIPADQLKVLDSCLRASFAGRTDNPPGFPLYLIQNGQSALVDLMSQVPGEAVSLWLTWRNEIGYWRCDQASRQRCTLVKQIVLLNLAGCRLRDQDPRFFVAYSRSSKRSEYLHPQLLARQVVVNPPSFMAYFWALGRRLLSEKLLKKVVVHSGDPAKHLNIYFQGALPKMLLEAVCRQGASSDVSAVLPSIEQEEAAARWVQSAETMEVSLPDEAFGNRDDSVPEAMMPAARPTTLLSSPSSP